MVNIYMWPYIRYEIVLHCSRQNYVDVIFQIKQHTEIRVLKKNSKKTEKQLTLRYFFQHIEIEKVLKNTNWKLYTAWEKPLKMQ